MSAQTVEYHLADGVGRIRLNRPESSNSIDLPTARSLADVVRRAAEDEAVQAVHLSGAGPRFCAGGDLDSMARADDQPAFIHELATTLDGALQALAAMAKPSVASVHGAVAGAGLSVMLSCDLVVADAATKFVFAFPSVGLTPDSGVSYLLPRVLGQQRALRFALEGKPWTAEQAETHGMVTQVTTDDQHLDVGLALATAMAQGPAAALGQTRRLLRDSWALDRAAAGAEETRTITEMVRHPATTALIDAFLAR